MELHGIGPSGAARLLADVADISRFADRDRFASWNGTAPLDASSGDQKRHRLPAPETAGSTAHCTSWPWSSYQPHPRPRLLRREKSRRERPPWKPCAR
ncbi:transposase [Micromonospora sp. NPDC049366]|uniref:transposase n=1 Tax=Micromonospora sp. NPDC049366 TaxID=3364271 RepID=UPI003796ED39